MAGPLGQAYPVPFRNGNVTEAQLIVGYRGLIRLATNTGLVSFFTAHEVCANDKFEYEYGKSPFLTHRPARGDRGKVEGYYAAVTYRDGGFDFEYMTAAEVHAHKEKYSKGWKRIDSPWQTATDEQGKKTVVRRLAKRVPMSPDLASIFQQTDGEPVVQEASALEHRPGLDVPAEDGTQLAEGEIPNEQEITNDSGPYGEGY
jgi:recombination protein RecT